MTTTDLLVRVTPDVDRLLALTEAVEECAESIAIAMRELRGRLENLPEEKS
jgi:hypothetical protein